MVEDLALTYRDFADSLRLDASLPPPKKDRYIKEAVVYIKGMIERMYGKYFGPNTLNRVRGLEDRTVTFYPNGLKKYLKLIGSDLGEDKLKSVKGLHADPKMGDIIGITPKVELARQPDIKQTIDQITAQGNSRRKVRDVVVTAALLHNLLHETFHAYETPHLPNYFDECAVPYYISKVQDQLGGFSLYSLDGSDRAKFYEYLIGGYGDEVNSLFFGGVRNRAFKKEVLSAYTTEILKELFPEGYGITKRELREFGV